METLTAIRHLTAARHISFTTTEVFPCVSLTPKAASNVCAGVCGHRCWSTWTVLHQSTQYAYDGSGHLSRVTDALGHITEFTHDPNGKLQAQSLPDGAHLSLWLGRGEPTGQSRDALSRSTRFAWNLRGQLTMREDGEGRRVALEYDGARRLARLTNENGESFAFEYNAGDQLIAEHRIGGQRVTVDYDVAG